MAKVSAIIVLYNPDQKTILKQYSSLSKQVENIIYVDNGSQNIKEIKKALALATIKTPYIIIENDTNIGLGAAQNQGIRYAIQKKVDYILLLDHDSVIRKDFVKYLLTSYESSKNRVAAVGPIYINEETQEVYPITRYMGPFIKRIIPTDEKEEASFLISSGSLISSDILKKIGLMNEDLFVDYIDVEWSYRARSKGYKLYAVPTAIMNHKIGDNRISVMGRKISMHSPLRRYYLTRNSIFMIKCPYISIGYKIREFVFNIGRILIFSIISNDKKKYLQYSLKGLIDGIHGRFGKCSFL